MLEKIKTSLLTLLVLSSIFLTWQIWSYQPDYDLITPTEYVEHEGLSKRSDVKDLLRAEKIIYHLGENNHSVAYPQMFQYRVIQQQMSNWYFYEFRSVTADQYQYWQSLIPQYEGIEVVFPAGVPFNLVQEITQIKMENYELPVINRIWIFQEEHGRTMQAIFISEDEQKMIRAKTSISQEELKNTYLALGGTLPLYKAYTFYEPSKHEIYQTHYITTTPTEIEEFRYFYRTIPIETMIQYLFVDPTLVRHIQDQGGTGFYTDGSRGLQYGQNKQTMYYYHPVVRSLQTSEESEQAIQKSIQFVNQHLGFDPTYFLYQINKSGYERNESVQFRKYVGNYPVFSMNTEVDHNVIQLEVQSDRVVGYSRPLIEIDRVIEQVKKELPAGEDVVQMLEEKGMHHSDIKNMFIGYRIEIRDYYILYIPCWVIELRNNERLFIEDIPEVPMEEPNNELE